MSLQFVLNFHQLGLLWSAAVVVAGRVVDGADIAKGVAGLQRIVRCWCVDGRLFAVGWLALPRRVAMTRGQHVRDVWWNGVGRVVCHWGHGQRQQTDGRHFAVLLLSVASPVPIASQPLLSAHALPLWRRAPA